MPEPTAAETIPKAIIRESAPTTGTPSPTETLAKEIIEKADEGEWREGLESLKKTPISESKITQKIEQIGIERDTDGKKVRQVGVDTDGERFGKAKTAAEVSKNFVEKGYDKLTTPEKDALRTKVLAELQSRPSLALEMAGLSDTQKQTLAERLLKNPRFTKEVRVILEGVIDTPSFDEAIITSAQEAVEDKQLKLDEALIDQSELNTRSIQAEAQRNQYEKNPDGTAKGDKAIMLDMLRDTNADSVTNVARYEHEVSIHEQRLQSLQKELDASKRTSTRTHAEIDGDIVTREEELADITTKKAVPGVDAAEITVLNDRMQGVKARLTVLRNESNRTPENLPKIRPETEIQSDIDAVEKNRITAQGHLDSNRNNVQSLIDLGKEETSLDNRGDEIKENKDVKDKEVKQLKVQLDRLKKTHEDSKAIRASQEQDLVDGLNNVFEGATGEWINNQVKTLTEELKAQLEKLKETTDDNDEKAMYDALTERWLAPEKTRKKGLLGIKKEKYRPIDRTKTNNDFAGLINNGPDGLMKDMLDGRIDTATGTDYTTEKIQSLMDNKEFMEKMRPEMIKQLLTRKHLTGGFTHEDLFMLEQTTWGKGMTDKAINNVNDYKGVIEKAFGAGILNSHGFREKFAKIAKNNPLWMLLLLGIPIAAIGALTMGVAEESIDQQY